MVEKCRCGKDAVFFRKYEGTHLCREHFSKSIERRVMKTVSSNSMISPGDHIIFALSGGKDSASACNILSGYMKHWKVRMTGVSIDEGTGSYRKDSIKAAVRLCKSVDIPHYEYSFRKELGFTLKEKVVAIRKKDRNSPHVIEPCTICSIGRRQILNKVARELGGTKICFGHTLDDEAQSVLMNFIRGDIQRAARGGPKTDYSLRKGSGFIPRIKPLREIPERETALYAWLNSIPHVSGSCPYTGGLRIDVRHFINNLEMASPGIKFSILHTYDKVLPCFRSVAESMPSKLMKCERCGEPSSGSLCRSCELWKST